MRGWSRDARLYAGFMMVSQEDPEAQSGHEFFTSVGLGAHYHADPTAERTRYHPKLAG